jgi:DNA-binding MarR family transcriptional regulator
MTISADECAREILETVPLVMRFIRHQIRRQRIAELSVPQFRALAYLSHAPGASLSAVAEHVDLSLPAMSRMINGLVANGFVARKTLSADRRHVTLSVTARGGSALTAARRAARVRLAETVGTLSPAQRETVRRAMRLLQTAFDPPATTGSGRP